MNVVKKSYDFVVIGGGLSGVCTAIAAARHGVRTALIQNRSVLGGNASSEMRIHINGADRNGSKKDLRESGIILELLLANKKVNTQHSYSVLDRVVWEKTNFQPNLDLYLNTHADKVQTFQNKIVSVTASQNTNETIYEFTAKYFADTTGDGTIAAEAGAEFDIGRDAKSKYNEPDAPDIADLHTMGSSVLFSMKDMGEPTPFVKPSWAYTFNNEIRCARKMPELSHGYWWVELGGDDSKVIEDAENISEELYKWAYGVFDYIKNSGEFKNTENLALDWVSTIAGKRESRRIIGDYVLNENDVGNQARFDDAIAYGGWPMDEHSVGGINARGQKEKGNRNLPVEGAYAIPYRCIYSKNIDNLFIGGRAISSSHLAMSSTRVIGTCSVIGQAIGTAVSIAVEKNISPREVGKNYINRLQQTLIKDDCYIPGIKTNDPLDLATDCEITASSYIPDGEPSKIVNGNARVIDGELNCWISDNIKEPQWINFKLPAERKLNELYLRFDPNFSEPIITTQAKALHEREVKYMPLELVKHYKVELINNGSVVYSFEDKDNFQRFCKIDLSKSPKCSDVKITVFETYGDSHARIFEARIY